MNIVPVSANFRRTLAGMYVQLDARIELVFAARAQLAERNLLPTVSGPLIAEPGLQHRDA